MIRDNERRRERGREKVVCQSHVTAQSNFLRIVVKSEMATKATELPVFATGLRGIQRSL